MLSRAALFCAALAVAPGTGLAGASTSALADSGGYRRPTDICALRFWVERPERDLVLQWRVPPPVDSLAADTPPGRPATSRFRGAPPPRRCSSIAPRSSRAVRRWRQQHPPTRPGGMAAMCRAAPRAMPRRPALPAAMVRRRSGPCWGHCRHLTAPRISGSPRPIRPISNGASRRCAIRTPRRGWRRSATRRRRLRAM